MYMALSMPLVVMNFLMKKKRQQAEDLKRQLLSVPNVKKSASLGFNNKPSM